jgi:hypothetical protein
MKLKIRLIAIVAAGCLVITQSAFAQSSDLIELRKEVELLRQEIRELKSARTENNAPSIAPNMTAKPTATLVSAQDAGGIKTEEKSKGVVTGGDLPGSFKLPDSNTSIRLYGFAELNWIHDWKATSPGDAFTFLAFQPLNGTAEAKVKDSRVVTARTSRIGFETSTPTSYGPLSVKVEGDFYRDRPNEFPGATRFDQASLNSQIYRLRLAYGQVGGWRIGQDWSTFMDVENTPETVDFNGPIGYPFLRQPVIRYTYKLGEKNELEFAVEASKSVVVQGTGFDAVPVGGNNERLPDLIARWNHAAAWGAFTLRGVTHELRVNTGTSPKTNKQGYGVGLGLSIKAPGNDLFVTQLTGGDGIGRYMYYLDGATLDAANNRILKEKAWGFMAGYTHNWSDNYRSTVAVGHLKTVSSEYVNFQLGQGNNPNKTLTQAHINLFWTPVKNIDIGAEYIWGERKTFRDDKGELSRIDLLSRFGF